MSYALTRLALRRSARAEARRRPLEPIEIRGEPIAIPDIPQELLETEAGRTHDALVAASVPASGPAAAPHPNDHSGDGAAAVALEDFTTVTLGPIGSAMIEASDTFPAKAGVEAAVTMDQADAEPVSRAGRATALPVERFGEIRKAPKIDFARVAAAHRAVGHGGGAGRHG